MLRTLFLFALLAGTPAKTDFPAGILGAYSGSLLASGYDMPVETRFFMGDGELVGEYMMDENGTLTAGTLTDITVAGPLTIECVWHDIYGSGPASFTFSEDLLTFAGWWSTADGTEEYYWRGSRAGSLPVQSPRENAITERK
ncbi:MAG TPA: hypothetical protein PLM22_06680 [Candidatus Sabulitectum sp.]|nr:hypothetical protein [Candidatus Sabulitectum sp.]HPF31590.1 hypothetical protein [Candidatus Sabulitectum sp.]HPJ28603.1 hypothetical protein [Candidatus Sabulitectum sp.]HPR22672.1 hypothetical protein [Candidatus Sabulitectum sp.]HRW77619.1 hypothetical protein [Candidatus Sabulitectum sp.]